MTNPSFIERCGFGQQTILLAEDSEDDIVIMRSALDKAGVSNPLQVVTDGDEAVSYLLGEGAYADRVKHPLPIVLLLDLKMPRRSGLEVLGWVRERPEVKRLTVHILSASTRAVDVARAAELGANAYLIKPSRYEDLITMLRTWHHLLSFQALPRVGDLVAT